ncbi:MAG: hypothetical protein ACO2PN_27160 [Pyrobaculum sp.]|jgi:hypothetical protein
MIVCTPDMTPDIAEKFGVQPCLVISLSRDNLDNSHAYKMWRFVDIGLTVAKSGDFPLARYLTLIRRARAHWAVAPDAFGNFRATLAQWFRYASVIARFTTPIFVAQEFHRPRILDTTLDLAHLRVVRRVAFPMRQHPDVSCGVQPRLCAERAERALRVLCNIADHIHLLGPPLRVVRLLRDVLRQCERQGTAVSFDTSAYRRAPNSSIKRQLGGRWQPRDSAEAEMMLEAWLRQALA